MGSEWETTISLKRIAQRLQIGSWTYVSNLLHGTPVAPPPAPTTPAVVSMVRTDACFADMAASDSYREFVVEQLGRVTPVSGKSMFGGVGVCAESLFFALVAEDRMYLKLGDTCRFFRSAALEPQACSPIEPANPGLYVPE